jgi:hypothetical protein
LHTGDKVVFVAGVPIGRAGSTNLMKLHRVGEPERHVATLAVNRFSSSPTLSCFTGIQNP